jgi:hypothetical protein
MIFFIDHQTVLLTRVDGHGPSAVGFGQLTADELPFDEELTIDGFHGRHVQKQQAGKLVARPKFFAHRPVHGNSVKIGAAAHEWKIRKIAGQPDPAADHDVRLGSGTPEPLAALTRELMDSAIKIHESNPGFAGEV